MSILRKAVCLIYVLAAFVPVSYTGYAASGDVLGIKTVVIDAGHGGHDPGAVSGNVREKDITLDVAVKLAGKIRTAFPEMNVILTRDRDVYIPLAERSAIANRNKADLFISVHVNSAGGASNARGTETFLMGTDKSESNMAVCRAENSVILLEDDYTTKYAGYDPDAPDSFIFFNLMQNAQFEQSIDAASSLENAMSSGPIGHSRGIKQAPLLVLWKTTMPAVLVEIGFLSNQHDRTLLSDRKSRDAVVECLCKGFVNYKCKYEGRTPSEVVQDNATADAAAVGAERKSEAVTETWSIQVFSISRKLSSQAPEMKGEKLRMEKAGNVYKYYLGRYGSRSEAADELPRVRKKFPGAFLVCESESSVN